MKVAACQTPDLRRNISEAISTIIRMSTYSEDNNADVVIFPECFLQGYFTESGAVNRLGMDLDSSKFKTIQDQLVGLHPIIIFGVIEKSGSSFFNTAVVLQSGELLGRYRKTMLLNGEKSAFSPGEDSPIFEISGVTVGINICYDLSFSEPMQRLASRGVEVALCPCNNMMSRKKAEEHKHLHNEIRQKRAIESGLWIVSSDVFGSRDDRISYGPTAAINPKGEVVRQLPLLSSGTLFIEI